MGGPQHVQISSNEKVPVRYLPRKLSTIDKQKQKNYLLNFLVIL